MAGNESPIPEIQVAFNEWVCGLMIALTPLTAHFFMFMTIVPATVWHNDWSSDTYLISVTNSGLSITTAVPKMFSNREVNQTAVTFLFLATALMLIFSTLGYGGIVAGTQKDGSVWIALGVFVGSFMASLFLVITTSRLR
jgi:hypothetical protein